MTVSPLRRYTLLLRAGLYAVAFDLIYRLYLFPEFERMKYGWRPHGIPGHVASLLIAVLPVLFYRGFRKVSSYICVMIYIVSYVPAIVTLFYTLERNLLELLAVQLCFLTGMCLLFLADRVNVVWMAARPRRRVPIVTLHVFTLVSTIIVLLTYLGSMKIVSFENVYALRFANQGISMAFFVKYLVMWLAACLYPLYFAIGLARKRVGYMIGACAGAVMIYMCTGAKLSLLTPVIIGGAYLALRFGRRLFSGLLAGVIGLSAALLFVVPKDNYVAHWAASLLFQRTLGTGGLASAVYYDYFQKHGYTYYTHVNIVNALTKGYPYGALQLGQVIGKKHFQNDDYNFSANFWATDGIAAAGIPGILIISAIVFLFLTFMNSVFGRLSLRFGALCATSFAMSLLNIPFFTALLSGGGLLLLLIVRYVRLEDWKPDGDHAPGAA